MLREQLVDSMGDRYAKLRYEAYRSEANYASAASARDVQSAMQRDGKEDPPGKFSHRQVSHPPSKEGDDAQEKQQTVHIVIPASSIDTARLPLNLEEAVSKSVRQSRAGKTLIENNGRLREPDLPSFQEGENFTLCGWCHQLVDRSVLHATRKKWSEEGRRHYMRDLQPYVCLSEDCRESRPSFASSFEWFNHMKSDHSDSWSLRIHNKPAWLCTAKHENDSVYTFSLKDQLLDHIRVHQCRTWVCTGMHENHSTFAFSSRDALTDHILDDRCNGKNIPETSDLKHPECLVKVVRQASSCPLCLFSMEDQSLNDQNASDDDGEEGVVTSQVMGSHIADHLHHVMTVSLRIMSIMQGSYDEHEGDIQSQPSEGSCEDAISDLDEEAMRKRFDDLPESVQGSMNWSDLSERPCEDAIPDLDEEAMRKWVDDLPESVQGLYDKHGGDIQSQPSEGSCEDAISDLDEEAMRKRFDDLPESVQGSMNWPDSSEGPCEDATSGLDREKARLPCFIIPPILNRRLFGRAEELSALDKAINTPNAQQRFRLTVLHGMGGVGKSAIAQQFVKNMVDQKAFDAVLWVNSQNQMSIRQSLIDLAVRLGLPGAHPDRFVDNCVFSLNWLAKTRKPSARLMSPLLTTIRRPLAHHLRQR